MSLQGVFFDLCGRYVQNAEMTRSYWEVIDKNYSQKSRHYHNLDHLSNMLSQLEGCRALTSDWDAVLFALFYHDLVYTSAAKGNEKKSAAEAGKALTALNVPAEKILFVKELILATKSHLPDENQDINLFTDADLSILGSPHEEYEAYASNVRKEYSIYPDLLYKPGRRKVLEHFLDMPHIFKTAHFRERLEGSARRNINQELVNL
jgi:predicted metal-dependent HD superfamily phosphohydrolase